MAASSKNYAKIKNFYNHGVWSETRVRQAVERKWITTGEFKKITGADYKAA